MAHTRINGTSYGEWLAVLGRNRKTAIAGDREAFEAGLSPKERQVQEREDAARAAEMAEREKNEAPLLSKDRTFNVPNAVGLALMSDRPELYGLAIASAKQGEIEPTRELVIELLALCANLQADRNEARDRVARFEEFYEEFREHHQSMVHLAEAAEAELS